MGEYIQVDGESIKLGTCEDLYYCRFEDMREWIAAGRASFCSGNLEPGEYLGGKFRFRFPFPDEDGPEAERLDAYGREHNRGVTVTAPAEVFGDVVHEEIRVRVAPRGVSYVGFSVSLPCPMGPNLDQVQHSPPPEARYIEIVQQRPIDGALWVVVRCAWCGAAWRLDRDQAGALAWHIGREGRAGTEYALFAELARRIMAGYETVTG